MLTGASSHQSSTFLYSWIIFTRDAIFFFIACFNGPTSKVWIVFGKWHSKLALSKQLFIPLESKDKVHLYLGWNLSQQILFPAMKIMCEKIEDTYADVPEVLWFPPDNNSGWCLVARPCNLLSRYSVRLLPQLFFRRVDESNIHLIDKWSSVCFPNSLWAKTWSASYINKVTYKREVKFEFKYLRI